MRRVMTFIIQLVTQQGACVRKARGLHYCAAHSQECPALAPLVELLCSIGGPEALHHPDAGGGPPMLPAPNTLGHARRGERALDDLVGGSKSRNVRTPHADRGVQRDLV